jgi:hypothetical protein
LNSNSIGFGFNLTTFKYIELNLNSIEEKWDMSAKKVKLMAHYFVSKNLQTAMKKF